MSSPNVAAFLQVIQHSEGVLGRIDAQRAPIDPYRICYGGYLAADGTWTGYVIKSLFDHPAITGEWTGVSLKNLDKPGETRYAHSISTAAGAYQITRPTWRELQLILRLQSFCASAQDDAAVQLIKERHALEMVNRGAIDEAITACSTIWASLPGSYSGQPQNSMASLLAVYDEKRATV